MVSLENGNEAANVVAVEMGENNQVNCALPGEEYLAEFTEDRIVGATIKKEKTTTGFAQKNTFSLANIEHPEIEGV
jgi:hypothetical protein